MSFERGLVAFHPPPPPPLSSSSAETGVATRELNARISLDAIGTSTDAAEAGRRPAAVSRAEAAAAAEAALEVEEGAAACAGAAVVVVEGVVVVAETEAVEAVGGRTVTAIEAEAEAETVAVEAGRRSDRMSLSLVVAEVRAGEGVEVWAELEGGGGRRAAEATAEEALGRSSAQGCSNTSNSRQRARDVNPPPLQPTNQPIKP
jgi:hypothetical protein